VVIEEVGDRIRGRIAEFEPAGAAAEEIDGLVVSVARDVVRGLLPLSDAAPRDGAELGHIMRFYNDEPTYTMIAWS
jgi:hypothetical protein